ncbi:BAI1-associated protein 3 isoform X2 [Toxorhynchites rutilus septentrionalis]|uniref:BAI1-associated protein 3 isoform X2 n=1 Tax=Toxorhynchites rutilus septentrionalis TaxID=329112 RepID=UPI002479D6EF|nr:BAI1-associated protein 3 isoform X2 [Toxorhynchites rutilus septentrionalis]
MSFFSSLQQYVTSGVAGLGLNPRRFSLSRQESTEATTPAASVGSPSPLMMMDPSKMNNTGGVMMGPPGSGGSIGSGSGGFGMGSMATGMGGGGVGGIGGGTTGTTLGYPKVVTPSGPGGTIAAGAGGGGTSSVGPTAPGGSGSFPGSNATSIRRQSSARGLDALVPPGRQGSFRGRNSPINPTPPDKPSFSGWKRRPSWPEVEIKSSSGQRHRLSPMPLIRVQGEADTTSEDKDGGVTEIVYRFDKMNPPYNSVVNANNNSVQENDGSYFESFTALSWKNENRRMSAVRAVETRAEILPENDNDRLLEDDIERSEQKEHLYLDVLYAIANTVGAPAPGGQFAHYKEEMYLQAQRVFSVSADRHYRLLHAANEEKPKIIVLTVIVQEAEGLEAKDANGFSDPYCMLGIQPSGTPPPPSPQPPMTPRTLSDTGMDSLDSPEHGKLRKHHSFRLSFKRKDGRQQRDSVGPVPAKFIRATSVKPHTLCPKWNEKFKFDIDDIHSDLLHLDIWDHDDESSVLDAVSRLNEVRGVRGLGRFFKQVCQSARQGSQDDFLGCVNIPVCDIPSTGLEGWFKLEARSTRSSVQGRIRLKMWLSTREDRGTSEEDHTLEVKKFERLQTIFMMHELSAHEPAWKWNGELAGPSLTILHQMAVQSDLSDLQISLAKLVAIIRINRKKPLDTKFIHRQLIEVDKLWVNNYNNEPLTRELEQWLADSLNGFVERSLCHMRRHREVFPALHPPSLVRLEFLLRCLGLLGSMRAFRQVSPFSKGVRGEIVAALRKGSITWSQAQLREAQRAPNALVHYTTILIADLQLGVTYYHSLFDTTNGIQYFSIVYKQFDSLLAEEVTNRIESGQLPGTIVNHWSILDNDREPDTAPFEIYFALQEFHNLKSHLSVTPQPPEKPLGLQNFHEWFEPAVQRWISVSKTKAIQRIKAAVNVDQVREGERIVRHSTSSIDTASCFYQIREFWKNLAWPDHGSSAHYEALIIDLVCTTANVYSDLIHQNLTESGYYDKSGPQRSTDDMCVIVNNYEYVRRALAEFQPDTHHLSENAENLLENTIAQLENKADRVLAKLTASMQGPLQKAVFHLAWSPDSLPANQAVMPLLEYLDSHLATLNVTLLSQNFYRSMSLIWNNVLAEFAKQMDAGGEGDKPSNFHDRMYGALQLLGEFFNAEGLGLPPEILHSDSYWRVAQRLQYHKTDTDQLIDLFYLQRLQEQLNTTGPTNLGTLSVKAYFNHDSLCVEVLHAKDVIPLDPNGFSDPFVIIELLPRRVFSHCSEQQTNVHKKTLNPVFDECFEFSVTQEQCQAEASMIVFTVMDHDVLTANDFAGEAFLSLANIPGVASNFNMNIENFDCVTQMDLPLLEMKDKSHPILLILEGRVNDKNAMEFLRKQKARVVD